MSRALDRTCEDDDECDGCDGSHRHRPSTSSPVVLVLVLVLLMMTTTMMTTSAKALRHCHRSWARTATRGEERDAIERARCVHENSLDAYLHGVLHLALDRAHRTQRRALFYAKQCQHLAFRARGVRRARREKRRGDHGGNPRDGLWKIMILRAVWFTHTHT